MVKSRDILPEFKKVVTAARFNIDEYLTFELVSDAHFRVNLGKI
jgi:hypothetical protein